MVTGCASIHTNGVVLLKMEQPQFVRKRQRPLQEYHGCKHMYRYADQSCDGNNNNSSSSSSSSSSSIPVSTAARCNELRKGRNHVRFDIHCGTCPCQHRHNITNRCHPFTARLLRQMCAFRMVLIFVSAAILVVTVDGSNPTYSLCYTQLIRADANGDQIIDKTTEWETAIQYISGGTTTSGAIDTTALFVTAGSTDPSTFSIGTVQDPSNNHAFCQALYAAIIAASSMQLDVSENKCFYAATIGDANRDSWLERYAEFPRYANQVSGNSYGFGTTYDELPAIVQSVFEEFVDDASAGTINIVGSKSSETVTTEQATKLSALCQSAAIAILAANGDVPTPVTAPVSVPDVPATEAPIVAPVAEATPVTTAPVTNNNDADIPDGFVASYTITDCLLKITFSDGSRDNALSSDEYYDFINRITDDAFAEYTSFDALPEALRNNFLTLAGGTADGTINVMGSKPGQTPTQEDTDRLNSLCTLTDVAIQGAGGASGETAVPVATPVGSVPVVSSISYDDCVKSMIIADISRNSLLDGKEFVRFISRLDSKVNPTDELSVLPPSIQTLFSTLATSNGEIDVTGSKPNEAPTPEQKAHLETICNQVGTALNESGNVPNAAPSSGSVTITNSFVLGNAVQMTASMLVPGKPDWEGLSKAYVSFIDASVSDLTTNRRRRATTSRKSNNINVNRRQLIVTGIVKDSPQLGQIIDAPCPDVVTIKDILCQVVFASFVAEFNDMDEVVVLATLTNNTQTQIYPRLNETLFSVNPSTAIYIIGPSDITTVNDTKPPKQAIVDEGDDGGGANVVQIIGALVIIGILIGGPVYYWKTRQRGKKKTNTVDENNDEKIDVADDEEVGLERAPSFRVKSTYTDDDDSEEEDPGNDEDESSGSNDDGTLTKNDQNGKAGGKKFKAFRLGKRRDSGADDDIGVLESNDGLAPGTDDYDNYEFDEPSELFVNDNADSMWGDSNWGNATSTITNNNNRGVVVDDSGPKANSNEHVNEHTEWSRSQSSGSNSAFETSSVVSGVSGDNLAQLGGLVDNGRWGGVLQTAAQFHNNLNDSISSRNSDHQSITSNKSVTETSHYDDNLVEIIDDPSDDQTPMTKASMTSEEQRRTEMYRLQIEDLVKKTAPDEIGNVKSMMEKFVGREAELINTLQTMHERLVSQRALKAVHKSKAIRARDVRDFASGGAETSAVIAAACMISSEEVAVDYNQGGFDYEGDESYYDHGDAEESGSGTRSYENEENETYKYDDENDQSRGGSYDDDDGRSGSYVDNYDDDDDNHSGSGSYDDDDEPEDSRDGSLVDQEHDENLYDYNDNDRSILSNEYSDEEDHSRASEDGDDETNDFDEFASPSKRGNDYDDEYEEDDAFGDEGERFDDEEFDDDFIGSASASHTGSYEGREGSTFASHSGSGSKSHSHNFVYDDGDGSYYSDEEHNK